MIKYVTRRSDSNFVENQTPLGYYYKYTIQGGLGIAIPQLLKIWKIKIENCGTLFSKINK
jgi:hypothetical protein